MDIKAKRLRREGFVTGNVFGRQIETSIPIKMDKQAVERLLKTCGKGSRITLDIEGTPYNAVSYTHLDVYKRQILALGEILEKIE